MLPSKGDMLNYVFNSVSPTLCRNMLKLVHFGKILSMKSFQSYVTGEGDLAIKGLTVLNQVTNWNTRHLTALNQVKSKGWRTLRPYTLHGRPSKPGGPDHVGPTLRIIHVVSWTHENLLHQLINVAMLL